MSWWSRFAPCTGGRILCSHQQGNLSTECPFYLKSHPNGGKAAISEYDKKQRIPKDVTCDLYYVINGLPVLIFLGELYIFWPKYHLEPDSINTVYLFQKVIVGKSHLKKSYLVGSPEVGLPESISPI